MAFGLDEAKAKVGLSLYFAIFFAKFGPFPEKKIREIWGFLGKRPCQLVTCAKFLANFV
jgi:hypothetical protein